MARESTLPSYDPAFFPRLAEIEDRHFWFTSRNRIIGAQVRRLVGDAPTGIRMVEVGCGTGNVLRVLDQLLPGGAVFGMDLFAEGLAYAQQRSSAALVQGDVHQPPFSAEFELIGLFDVLEHLPDDRQVLCSLRNMLSENGLLLLTVPAHPRLWSYFDEAAQHRRRYRLAELRAKLNDTGYAVEFITPTMMAILPLVWIGRHVAQLRSRMPGQNSHQSDANLASRELRLIPVINTWLAHLLSVEAHWLGRGHRLPAGASLLVIARRRN
jgi:SAM-dependent methyltransferase